MPKTVPWERSRNKPERNSSPAIKQRREANSSDEALVDEKLNPIRPTTPKKKIKKIEDRSPSTSPAPAPPDVEYMREGYDEDDIYRMVEDEFWTTAQSFTQHIHREEYKRLKKLAQFRGDGTLRSIARPTDGRTKQSEEVKLKLEAEGNVKKRKFGMRDVDSEGESSEDDDSLGDPQLAGLMTAGSQGGRDLLNLTKTKSKSRAAAGLQQSPRNIEKKRDALEPKVTPDANVLANRKATSKSSSYSSADEEESRAAPVKDEPIFAKGCAISKAKSPQLFESVDRKAGSIFKQFAKPGTDRLGARQSSPTRPAKAKVDFELPSKPAMSSARDNNSATSKPSDWLTKRRAEKERKAQEERKKSNPLDDIPTFLF